MGYYRLNWISNPNNPDGSVNPKPRGVVVNHTGLWSLSEKAGDGGSNPPGAIITQCGYMILRDI